MSGVGFIILALAVWRLSHALVKEKGPLDVFVRFRAKLAFRQKRSGGLFDMFSCVACTSFWVALIATFWVISDVLSWFGYSLAISGLVMLIESLFSKDFNSFKLVAPPATYNKVSIGGSTSPEKRNDVIGHPHPPNLPPAIKT